MIRMFGCPTVMRHREAFFWLSTLLLTLSSPRAYAHLIGSSGGEFDPWTVDPVAIVLLIVVAVLYVRGSTRIGARQGVKRRLLRKRMTQFWIGWACLVIALASPMDALGEVLFSAHMIQHELLMLVAGPLLVLSRPGSHLVLGARSFFTLLIRCVNGGDSRFLAGFWRGMLSPLPAWTLHFVGLWVWHIPILFNAGLTNTLVHSLQHISFLLIALIFWYSLLRKRTDSAVVAVVSLFTTATHASLLGALLTFSPEVWYTPYIATTEDWGLTPLQDQQLGGLIMWMPAGVVYIAAALILLAQYLRNWKGKTDSSAPSPWA